MAEMMTQSEIDALVNSLTKGEFDMPSPAKPHSSSDIKYKHHAVVSILDRFDFARQNFSFEEQLEIKRQLHHATFNLWLANRGMKRDEYYRLMNRELQKRGFPPVFKI